MLNYNKLIRKLRRNNWINSILFILFLLYSSKTFSQEIIPSYNAILNKFKQDYSPVFQDSPKEIRFEKTPLGWFVAIKDYSENKIIQREIFWENESKKYYDLTFPNADSGEYSDINFNLFNDPWLVSNYESFPYFGYIGWDSDIIKNFSTKPNLSDSLLYALGYAYSSYASNLLHNNSGFADTTKQFKFSEQKYKLTSEQLTEYLKYRNKAIELYNKLAKRNPIFKTYIGDIYTKLSNEYLTLYLDLVQYHNENEAKKVLPENLYDNFYHSFSKNVLNSCEKNAILFTNGDNDTYPLLYQQAKFNFRTDVRVLNINLLQTPVYINALRNSLNGAQPLPLSLSQEDFINKSLEVVIVKDSSGSGVKNLDQVFNELKTNISHV